MEVEALNGMDKLMPTIEQGKLLGIIREPKELETESINHFTSKGMIIGSAITILLFSFLMTYYQYQDRKKRESYL